MKVEIKHFLMIKIYHIKQMTIRPVFLCSPITFYIFLLFPK